MKPIILVGAFSEAIELCEKCGYEIIGIVDSIKRDTYEGYRVLGTDADLIKMKGQYSNIPLVIVPDSPKVRKKLYMYYLRHGFHFETVISPNATISPSAAIGEGCFIQNNCNISSKVILKNGVRINCGANIMHEAYVDEFSTIAPNAVILGRCKIGKEAYIGANATILPEHIIGDQCTVGAAAVVTKDIVRKATVIGNPARQMGVKKCT